ncbi:predicted protein [Sclerotinia sclerotiorum 1980 UF-70]|uniref:Uncharacterized protein n=1 Tax=Sclerotinia sclerotiorum (strain ATCC 18683 / 1980 / Ss-1) TaxID=665079 RepID=A7EJ39_SCLS1|nr:predicted protein [Sclerotinia sclerotiorum 1980 UF-70]EDO02855.1 predicted protein [Sclerotinia sclerotiorum 1980 UF-70]
MFSLKACDSVDFQVFDFDRCVRSAYQSVSYQFEAMSNVKGSKMIR